MYVASAVDTSKARFHDHTAAPPHGGDSNVPLVKPVYLTSTFRLSSAKRGAEYARSIAPPDLYTRWGNPTVRELEQAVADLEGGKFGLATGSGMGAISAAILSVLRKGDGVVAGKGLYTATTEFLFTLLPKLGIQTVFVDPREPGGFERAVRRNTRLVFVETPANPTMDITDLREAVQAARDCDALAFCDNTLATPINQRPLDFDVDIVLHSATKYLSGHSDVVAGAAVCRDEEIFSQLWYTYKLLGPCLGPMEAFLVRRGLKTLSLRVKRHNSNALELAAFLEVHPQVSKVYYPGLESFPQRELATKQMKGFGGMLSFQIAGGYRAAVKFVESVKLATLAISLGETETLIEHAASTSHGALSSQERKRGGIKDNLIRVSVGLEDIVDLKHDFDQALRKAAS